MRAFKRLRIVRAAVPAVVGLLTVLALVSPAAASTATTITVRYPVSGSTYLQGISSTAALGPGTLSSTINLKNGKLRANLALPPASASFMLGLLPASATTAFIQDGHETGTLNLNTGAVTTTAQITLEITAVSIAGLPLPVPAGCETVTPVTITVTSQPGFSVVNGGTVTGTYTIPQFAGCGLLTPIINLSIPGSGNTISLTLGAAKRI